MLSYPLSDEEIKKYIAKLDDELKYKNYKEQETSINLLKQIFPYNKDLSHILLKCCAINTFYSTNIFSIYSMGRHIYEIKDFDQRLKKGDTELIREIAKLTISGKEKFFYSFASKYCSYHHPDLFPIYDNYVGRMLITYSKFNAQIFQNKITYMTLRDYTIFKQAIEDLKNYFSLKSSFKELDLYLWLKGKELFK